MFESCRIIDDEFGSTTKYFTKLVGHFGSRFPLLFKPHLTNEKKEPVKNCSAHIQLPQTGYQANNQAF